MEQHEPGLEVEVSADEVSTDEVLIESVERVRASRRLIHEIDLRLERSQRLLDDETSEAPVR